MSTCRMWVKGILVIVATIAIAAPARAQGGVAAANSDFPDNQLVMPFASINSRSTFFSITNVDTATLRLRWAFFDQSGEKIDEVSRDILGQEGSDVVDLTAISDKTIDSNGNVILGPARSLAGHDGFVIVSGNGTPNLLGNFTIANLGTNSGYGVNAAGFGFVGTVASGQGLLGTTFRPSTLQDNLLVIIGLQAPPNLNSLTGGSAASGTVFRVVFTLFGNGADPVVAQTTRDVRGSALFTSLEDLFPGADPGGSATIFAFSQDAGIIGWYGQAVGPFGAGQSLRAVLVDTSNTNLAVKKAK